jgi:hypothetical protein
MINGISEKKYTKSSRDKQMDRVINFLRNTIVIALVGAVPLVAQSPNKYRDYEAALMLLEQLSRQYPDILKTETIGYSLSNRPIVAVKISDRVQTTEEAAEPPIAFEAGMHGDEVISSEVAMRLIEYLCRRYDKDRSVSELVDNREIWILPFVNPDGYVAQQRNNAASIDLNRDWGYMWQGWGNSTAPYSQPETQALFQWITTHNFVAIQSLHAGMQMISLPWSCQKGVFPDYDPAVALAESYIRNIEGIEMSFGCGFERLYPVFGSAKDAFYALQGALSWTTELSDIKAPSAEQAEAIFYSHLPALLKFIDDAGQGIRGKVVDAETGQPIAATIFVSNHTQSFWPVFSNPQSGHFYKYALPGSYRLRVTANHYQSKTIDLNDFAVQPVIALRKAAHRYACRVVAASRDPFAPADQLVYRVLGEPDHRSYHLGMGGWIIIDMGEMITDMPGNELEIFEGDMTANPIAVWVSESPFGEWQFIGKSAGTAQFDIAGSAINAFRYVRISDCTPPDAFFASVGYALDAVAFYPESATMPDAPAIITMWPSFHAVNQFAKDEYSMTYDRNKKVWVPVK